MTNAERLREMAAEQTARAREHREDAEFHQKREDRLSAKRPARKAVECDDRAAALDAGAKALDERAEWLERLASIKDALPEYTRDREWIETLLEERDPEKRRTPRP